MSEALAAHALEEEFERIRVTEFTRLRRKFGALSPEHVAEVDAITAHVVHAIARRPVQVLERGAAPDAARAALELFRVPPSAAC